MNSRARVFVQLRQILPTDGGASARRTAARHRSRPPDADLGGQSRKGRARHRSRQDRVDRPRRRRSDRGAAKGDQAHRAAGQSVRDHRHRAERQAGAADHAEADRHLRRGESRRRSRRQQAIACASSISSSTCARRRCRKPRPRRPISRHAISARCRAPARSTIASARRAPSWRRSSRDLAAAQSGLSAVNGQMAGTPTNVAGQGAPVTGPARARLAGDPGPARRWRRPRLDRQPSRHDRAQQPARRGAGGGARRTGRWAARQGRSNPLYLSLKSMQADKASTVAALTQRKGQIESDLDQIEAKMAGAPGGRRRAGPDRPRIPGAQGPV